MRLVDVLMPGGIPPSPDPNSCYVAPPDPHAQFVGVFLLFGAPMLVLLFLGLLDVGKWLAERAHQRK